MLENTKNASAESTSPATAQAVAENCVLVNLTICQFDIHRKDSKISKEVADSNDVKDLKLCRVRKSLLPKTAQLKEVHAIAQKARLFHYENTHAWMFDGPRILMTSNFEAYSKKIREFEKEFQVAVNNLVDNYGTMKDQAKSLLGSLYNERDYPDKDKLKKYFQFKMKVQPLPSSASLLNIKFEGEDQDALRAELEADMAETFQKANKRLWQNLFEKLEKLYVKLQDEEATVRESTLKAVRDLVELLPQINITKDPKLEELANQLKASLDGLSHTSLNTNPDVRKKTTEQANKIFNVMQSYMHGTKKEFPTHEIQRAA